MRICLISEFLPIFDRLVPPYDYVDDVDSKCPAGHSSQANKSTKSQIRYAEVYETDTEHPGRKAHRAASAEKR